MSGDAWIERDPDLSLFDVLREVRDALHVPEGASIIEVAKLHFARSVIACNVYNAMDSMPEGVGEEFMREIVTRGFDEFP